MKSLPNLTDIFDMKRRSKNPQLVFKGEKCEYISKSSFPGHHTVELSTFSIAIGTN